MSQPKHDSGHRHGHHHGHGHHAGAEHPPRGAAPETIDPVCGMSVDPNTALQHRHGGETYYFCSARCRERFAAEPAKYLAAEEGESVAPSSVAATSAGGATVWTCPMHPEIRRDALFAEWRSNRLRPPPMRARTTSSSI
jgi:Cu+-exporting ATPase